MSASWMMRRASALLASTGVVLAAALTGLPASAGLLDGDVTNRLPSSYTVKIATFVAGGPERCPVDGGATYSCRTYWLPSGKADGQIGLGKNFDVDGFMVEQRYVVERWGGTSSHWVPAFKWTKISSIESVTCFVDGRPICEVE